jgi:hypothetical protein
MEINWRAVLSGFVVAVVIGLLVSWAVPVTETAYVLALPGLVGGFVAGYMVSGVGRGAIHGALATVVGALALLAVIVVMGALFVGILPALTSATVGVFALAAQSIPGALAGALGGWMKHRRAPETTAVSPR